MKRLFTYLVLASSVFLCSCEREQRITERDDKTQIILSASVEQPSGTKTAVQEDNSVFWDTAEEIKVFCGGKSAKFTSTNEVPAGSVCFKGDDIITENDDEIWALYPYDENATFSEGVITVTVPSEQIACAGTFARNTNVTVAHSESGAGLMFYNVCGGVRFTVTEEGIKKVIIEGLDGEVIAGKVKIGFDGNERPYVAEVIDGRKFITISSPDEGSFKPGTWYYVSALPSTLKKGFKMRFYKKDIYGKVLIENEKTIKRSIFGTLSEADKGVPFEKIVFHSPESEEEWEESIILTHEIGDVAADIIETIDFSSPTDIEDKVEEIKAIDGVIDVLSDVDQRTITVIQRDSVFVYYSLDLMNFETDNFKDGEASKRAMTQTSTSAKSISPISSKIKEMSLPVSNNYMGSKKALILAPYQAQFEKDLNRISLALLNAGFKEDNIEVYENDAADVTKFKGSYLSQFDYIFIDTHGGIWYYDINDNVIKDQTTLMTGTEYDLSNLVLLTLVKKELRLKRISICYTSHENEKGKEIREYRFCMTPEFLDTPFFNTTIVFLGACYSSRIMDNANGGSMMQTFLDKGVGAVAGYHSSIASGVNSFLVYRITQSMAHGLSFQDASKYWKNHELTNAFCQSGIKYYRYILWPESNPKWSQMEFNKEIEGFDPTLYDFFPESGSFSLVSLSPYNIEANQLDNGSIEICWTSDMTAYSDYIIYKDYSETQCVLSDTPIDFTVEYSLYLDNKCIAEHLSDNKYTLPMSLSKGDHKCRVVNSMLSGGTIVGSYSSADIPFTITGSMPESHGYVDLGLSVKWATCNVGASKPEEYGDYYAWGETETKSNYEWSTYKWCNGSYDTLTKYCDDSYFGTVDNKTVLDPDDDVAHVKWGGSWRMPTDAEWTELRENCTWTWTTLGEVYGRLVTSKKEGYTDKSIFLPAAGYRTDTRLLDVDSGGLYWSSSLDRSRLAWIVDFYSGFVGRDSGYVGRFSSYRYYGRSVRPVSE